MTTFSKRASLAALAGLLGVAIASPVLADIKDFEFQLVQTEVKKGDATIAVRLVNKKTSKAVPDAVISAKRIDMAPDGMAEMATKIDPPPSTAPGVYRFQAHLPMESRSQ